MIFVMDDKKKLLTPLIKTASQPALLKLILTSILGGACICLGTYASKLCPFPILSPLLFAVGILMVMAFNFELITRHVPTKGFSWQTAVVLVVNLLAAGLLGFFAMDIPTPDTPNLLLTFANSILGGIVIGCVSLNNLADSPYKAVIALLLMYLFVMLGLPHCVVASFLHVDFGSLIVITAGNLIGGGLLRFISNNLEELERDCWK